MQMIMCTYNPKAEAEKESVRDNLEALLIRIENGEKKLCKLFKKTKTDGNDTKTTK